MPNQARVPVAEIEPVGCCSPLVREPLTAGQAAELSRVFKALGDPVRLQLMSMIASHEGGETCVCDLTPAFELTGPTISHHLKVLREAGLVDAERRGTWVYYRIRPGRLRRGSAVLVPDQARGRDRAAGSAAAGRGPGTALLVTVVVGSGIMAAHALAGRRRAAAAGELARHRVRRSAC